MYPNFVLHNKNSKAKWNTFRSPEILRSVKNANLPDNLKDVSKINPHFLAINHVIKTPEQLSLLDKYSTEKQQLINFHYQEKSEFNHK
ncbi:hypothetical protein JTB14_037829 [Gonioctena quinquepunctata]|nr:hypothetical protein JTB14_037829 [Gonioctena quinquepunctata]